MKNFLTKLKEIYSKLKSTDAITKFLLGLSVIFIGIMIVYMVGQIHHIHLFHQREAWGNERWRQVDDVLHSYDDRIKELECKINSVQ